MYYGTHYSQNKQLEFRLLCVYIPITSVPKTWFQGVDSSLESVAGSDLFRVRPGSLGWRHCHLILLTSHGAAIWSWGVSTQAPVVTNRGWKSVMMFLHIIVSLNNQGWCCLMKMNPMRTPAQPKLKQGEKFSPEWWNNEGRGYFLYCSLPPGGKRWHFQSPAKGKDLYLPHRAVL